MGVTEGQVAAHQAGTHIIRITHTGHTWLVTVEDASTGRIPDHLTRVWTSEAGARGMARNAYRVLMFRSTFTLAA